MRPIPFPLVLAAFALTACQQSAPSAERDEPPTGAPTAAASPPPGAAPSPSPTAATAIPQQFHGVWDYAEGSCNPASDLRLDIGASRIEFYESVGQVVAVEVESPATIVVEMAMEGEGEKWTSRTRFALSDDGATLTPQPLEPAAGEPMPRERCPA